MSWNPFRAEYKTTVGTSIQRVMEDKNIVDSMKVTVLKSTQSNTDLVDELLEGLNKNIAIKANQAYNYGSNHYHYGLPAGLMYGNASVVSVVKPQLELIEGEPVTIEYANLGAANRMHLAWMYLISQYGYDTQTNKLNTLSLEKNSDVYLLDLQLMIPAAQKSQYSDWVLQVWDAPPNSGSIPGYRMSFASGLDEAYYKASPVIAHAGVEQIKMKYIYKKNVTEFTEEGPQVVFKYVEESLTFLMSNPDVSASYFQVKYSTSTAVKYWTYKMGTGTYSSLDLFEAASGDAVGEYYPNVYFRLNKTNLGTNQTTTAFKTSKRLADTLGFKYGDLINQIHENPDIADVEQGFMCFAVPADTTDADEIGYLYEYFNTVYNAQTADQGAFVQKYLKEFQGGFAAFQKSPKYAIEIKDAAFKMQLRHAGIVKNRRVGSIGAIGSVAMLKEPVVIQGDPVYDYETGSTTYLTETIQARSYRKQISLNFYEEIKVFDLSMLYFILNGHNNTIGDADKEIILIPLEKDLVGNLSLTKKERLYSRALHMVFNAVQVTKISWYQQGWFADLLFVAGIVATVYSLGTDGGAFIEAAAAISAGAYATAVQIILVAVGEYILIQEGFKLFVKAVGIDIAILAALVAAAYGISDMVEKSTLKLTANAKEFLTLATGLIGGAQNNMKDLYEDLLSEYKEFDALKEEKESMLQKAQDLLHTDFSLNPLIILGESPNEFFNRTVHSGNIGTVLMDDIHLYYKRSLALVKNPEIVIGA